MLKIDDLHVSVDGTEIIKGLSLEVKPGEVHAIMGPNGAGKSTLASTLAGRDAYEVTAGSVHYAGKDLLALAPHERAGEGIFLGFQYPVEIPGVSNLNFLRTALNAQRRYRGEPELNGADFMKLAKDKAKDLEMSLDMLKRFVNVGFSGGEKKRNEMVQMAVLDPKLAILDETDSGLDIDALKTVSQGINALRGSDRAILLITHYQRLLDYVVPDHVHVLADGRIVRSGGKDLAHELEAQGYAAAVA
ncbi:Fe-S cluster assembly ATP-binding protein [Rhodothalassium salexigens DSM 2132]|uniref:Fe-S cluster assembly ATP-binding protein n=1 Tax=Rhodothalassium salexigens DSM 2132 TaxID=1188247 RepID=A0A4R2PKU7_RHOSA|nr:Fe-S cluster assembly ATPase SufC [Rhodothalassium salexigens]MBB4211135.1 Fe-S cluster assembly ATP-binding protein [Rhodothalassium salexigens DSM 2132]MBK1637476.1 Fe-S cluster assembly ATPase SufC [Rhodothalassium salexigens DSM 2132]TCP36209.1 Fe-S cluster assembly ATP-binding protein [Rhodothalassium salexigens DSM 2132]